MAIGVTAARSVMVADGSLRVVRRGETGCLVPTAAVSLPGNFFFSFLGDERWLPEARLKRNAEVGQGDGFGAKADFTLRLGLSELRLVFRDPPPGSDLT